MDMKPFSAMLMPYADNITSSGKKFADDNSPRILFCIWKNDEGRYSVYPPYVLTDEQIDFLHNKVWEKEQVIGQWVEFEDGDLDDFPE